MIEIIATLLLLIFEILWIALFLGFWVRFIGPIDTAISLNFRFFMNFEKETNYLNFGIYERGDFR